LFFPTYQSFLHNLFFPIFTGAVFIATLMFIPRKLYKKYFIYGLITGAAGDFLVALLLESVNLIEYKNAGVFTVLGLNFWAPISWMFVHMIFLYFLPQRRPFLYIYILSFAMFSRVFSNILSNLNLFEFRGVWPYASFFVFLFWYGGAAWLYRKAEKFYTIT